MLQITPAAIRAAGGHEARHEIIRTRQAPKDEAQKEKAKGNSFGRGPVDYLSYLIVTTEESKARRGVAGVEAFSLECKFCATPIRPDCTEP